MKTPEPCVCCEVITTGHFGQHDKPAVTFIPVCENCYFDPINENNETKFSKWLAETIKILQESRVAFKSNGNLAEDRKTLEAFLKHDARIEDGVCPNGCARMNQVEPGHQNCPVCDFHGFTANLSA